MKDGAKDRKQSRLYTGGNVARRRGRKWQPKWNKVGRVSKEADEASRRFTCHHPRAALPAASVAVLAPGAAAGGPGAVASFVAAEACGAAAEVGPWGEASAGLGKEAAAGRGQIGRAHV